MKNLLSILLISIIVIPVIGQEALFNHYGKSEGLSSSEVFDLNQDKSGRIWVATTKGLVTLEGLSFQLHPMNDVLKQSVIVGFFKSENILGCYSTDGKLFLLDDYKLTPVALNAQLQETMLGKIVNQARPDESNNIWISNVIGGGLIEVQTDSRQIIKHNIRGDFNYFVKQLAENQFIAGSVSPVTGKSNQLRVYFSDLELEISLSGNSEFNKSKFSKLINSSYLFSAGAEVVNFDKKGIIARLFTEKKVECLFEDSEQKIWIGLNQGGVICFPTGHDKPPRYYLFDRSSRFKTGIRHLSVKHNIKFKKTPSIYIVKLNTDRFSNFNRGHLRTGDTCLFINPENFN